MTVVKLCMMNTTEDGRVIIPAPKNNPGTVLKSQVIRVENVGCGLGHLSEPLVIIFPVNSVGIIPGLQRLSCQFYNVTEFRWNDTPDNVTNLTNFNSTRTVTCSYDHMTPFAVLLVNNEFKPRLPAVLVGGSLCVYGIKPFYGTTQIQLSDTNETTKMCWITDARFLYGMNITYFSLTFLFNTCVLAAVTHQIFKLRCLNVKGSKLPSCRNVCTVLGLTLLLGTTWGLAFFTSGYTNYPVLYLFCICNSLSEHESARSSGLISGEHEAKLETEYGHVIHIPTEAIIKSGWTENTTLSLMVSVLNNTIFEASSNPEYVDEKVLGVWLGEQDVNHLSQPVKIQFVNTKQNMSGTCVFWKRTSGQWSSDGCNTTRNDTDFVCSCNHLSFFAVLISSDTVEDPHDIRNLEYITYIGSSFSVLFTAIVIILFLIQRKGKSEHSIVIHVQLTGSLFLLHLFFLASALGSGTEINSACQCLGLILHWALLATFTWTAIEGFHLYLLLVRVFNIYIRRYLLKLCVVGWGVPVITVMICGLAGGYGKYTLTERSNNETNLCWITNKTVRYITVNSYMALVLLFNVVIMSVIVVKMWQLKLRGVQTGNRLRRLWKDCAIILGLGVVLGLSWGLAFFTYGPLSLPGMYIFTTVNSFQGVFVFLWFLSLTCKSTHEEGPATKNLSLSNFSS
ncbi:adhesion G protein-coupled receptor G3-like [Clarias magur]|uniref:Adhesion G protein-coupled receptor G3-like n=1 Tax=Clarias magur TaxID=1594786 RepID=A0A8J4U3G2_CLAMG|nr:adhesion G protein-coupled receptor G3-like [Clarias magur]